MIIHPSLKASYIYSFGAKKVAQVIAQLTCGPSCSLPLHLCDPLHEFVVGTALNHLTMLT